MLSPEARSRSRSPVPPRSKYKIGDGNKSSSSSCKTVIQIRSCTTSMFVLIAGCVWMILWTVHSQQSLLLHSRQQQENAQPSFSTPSQLDGSTVNAKDAILPPSIVTQEQKQTTVTTKTTVISSTSTGASAEDNGLEEAVGEDDDGEKDKKKKEIEKNEKNDDPKWDAEESTADDTKKDLGEEEDEGAEEEAIEEEDDGEENGDQKESATNEKKAQQQKQKPDPKWDLEGVIPVFYNLFVQNLQDSVRVRKIVDEQFNKLIPGVHGPVYVNSIGVPLDLNDTKVVLLGHHETAAEHVTLKALWDYCRKPEHSSKKVVYLHSKGSFTATQQNGKLRRFLTTGALSNDCATMPDDQCNICSSRFSPVPHPHTSGNMWLAKCDYISRLIDPEKFEDAMDSLEYDGGHAFLACDGRGRYSAEHWVHSHPSVRPCDLYSDSRFTWNYDGIPVVKEFKRNYKLDRAPRFDLIKYVKTNIRDCPGRGASQKFRIDEYKGLYNEDPPKDWWGYNFLKEEDDWWPHRDYGWVQLPEEARQAIIKLGYNHHLWETRHRPYQLYGKKWHELTADQLATLEGILTYDEETWNKEVGKEYRDRERIARAVKLEKPNLSFDRCDPKQKDPKHEGLAEDEISQPWYKFSEEDDRSKPLRDYVYERSTTGDDLQQKDKRRVLIIASVPRDATHITTLWSELECFTDHVDHVILSAPTWGEPYIERVLQMVHKYIPHFRDKKVTIESKFFLNNRYDVGLWCDAYHNLNDNGVKYDEYGLLNDSVFALRRFSAIFDNLEHQKVHMTSLSYSYTYKWNKAYGPEEFWVESVYRGFDTKGIEIFDEHSCVAEDHPFFCPEEDDNKACIINNFEHDLAKEYPCDKVQGLYPADSPKILTSREKHKRTWIKNTRYWRMLVDEMGFPIAKANEPEQIATWWQLRESKIAWEVDPLLKNCTKYFPMDEIFKDLRFKMAKPFYKRKWQNLPPEVQSLALNVLGYDDYTWNRGKDSPLLAGKSWNMLSLSKQKALQALECSKLQYDQNECRVQNPIGPKENEMISVSSKTE